MSARKALAHMKEASRGVEEATHLLELVTLMGDDPSIDMTLVQVRKGINKILGHSSIAHEAVTALIERRKSTRKSGIRSKTDNGSQPPQKKRSELTEDDFLKI